MRNLSRDEFAAAYGPAPDVPDEPAGLVYTSGYNLAALLCLARGARRILEFGTARGQTTLALARFCPLAKIVTLDVHPDWLPDLAYTQDTRPPAEIGAAFRGTPEAARITQIIADPHDPWPLDAIGTAFDLAFVDSLHTYVGVAKDTAAALAVVRPGGVIVWDDYLAAGVPKLLSEIDLPLTHVVGARLVFSALPFLPIVPSIR